MAAKIIVTGHRGYIGSEIFFRLQMMGLHPTGIDLKDGRNILKYMSKCDLVIHCAAQLTSKGSLKNNTEMTKAILRKAKKVIFLSSAAVYGESMETGSEVGDALRPVNEYGESKVACEKLIRKSKKQYAILRLSNVYSSHAIHGVISRFMHGNKIIYGNGKQIRDFVSMEKVVETILFYIEIFSKPSPSFLLNVSSGRGITINHLFMWFFPDDDPIYLPSRKGDIFRSILV